MCSLSAAVRRINGTRRDATTQACLVCWLRREGMPGDLVFTTDFMRTRCVFLPAADATHCVLWVLCAVGAVCCVLCAASSALLCVQASIDAFVSKAKVVLATAGPFVKYSSEVVESCARLGTHCEFLAPRRRVACCMPAVGTHPSRLAKVSLCTSAGGVPNPTMHVYVRIACSLSPSLSPSLSLSLSLHVRAGGWSLPNVCGMASYLPAFVAVHRC